MLPLSLWCLRQNRQWQGISRPVQEQLVLDVLQPPSWQSGQPACFLEAFYCYETNQKKFTVAAELGAACYHKDYTQKHPPYKFIITGEEYLVPFVLQKLLSNISATLHDLHCFVVQILGDRVR